MLAQRRGAIVNLGSIAGLAGIPVRNAYGAAGD
jgi:NADP-dependent 3-hydroxy acid dehydrogenase YdfG